MATPLRRSFGNAVYHVTARGNRREHIFYINNIEIRCDVLFSDEFTVEFNLLGRAAIFDRFKVCFDDPEVQR
jgi:hypothetical protein